MRQGEKGDAFFSFLLYLPSPPPPPFLSSIISFLKRRDAKSVGLISPTFTSFPLARLSHPRWNEYPEPALLLLDAQSRAFDSSALITYSPISEADAFP